MKRGPKPTVTYEGRTYTTRRWNVTIPDLRAMTAMEAKVWLLRHTTPRGYTRPRPQLPAIELRVR